MLGYNFVECLCMPPLFGPFSHELNGNPLIINHYLILNRFAVEKCWTKLSCQACNFTPVVETLQSRKEMF